MQTEIIRANSRGHLNFGWLDTYHTFSFGEYYNPKRTNFGALRVINDDYMQPNSMFSTHPHNNMEIITLVHSGIIEHQDSMGNLEKITAGEIQVMSAGSGITHSERNPSQHESLNLFQIWIYPKHRDIKPRYYQKSFSEQLKIRNTWHTLVSPDGKDESLTINQEAFISIAHFDSNTSSQVSYKFKNKENGVLLMLIDGEIVINDTSILSRDAITIIQVDQVNFISIQETKLIAIEVPMVFDK